ncbi:MAG: thiamine pyrophosphate-binding protein [Candidatus Rokubacteria bacterium]|nr:thiamine pyrophosphate-binding protein [Candidatus Rokubacteria bacterium]
MTPKRRGADLVVDALVEAGVRHLFTLSGNHILSLYDATIGRGVTLVHTRHEAAAVHMADAWGRLTGEPGVALVTAGPGHANALSALYGALMAESPVVLLSGHCPRGEIGLGGFQEMDQVAAARPVAKAAWLAERPERAGDDVREALAVAASGRPGPVHVSLPGDVLDTAVDVVAPARAAGREAASLTASAAHEIVAQLAGARRPLILCGPATARGAALQALVETASVPALGIESPRGVNDPALRAAARCLADADVVLLLGKALDFSLRFGGAPFTRDCRFWQVAPDAPAPAKSTRIERAWAADVDAALGSLVDAARARAWPASSWRADVEAARTSTPPGWDTLRRDPGAPMHPLAVARALAPWIDAGAVLVSDGGEFGQWMQAALEPRERLINSLSGSIGSAIPMAVAAKLRHPARTVLVTLGDGTFGYHAFELDTALRHGLPVVAVVGNDARWNAEHQLQIRQYGADRTVGCELRPSRYEQVAVALGGHGEYVERAGDLPGALERAVASGRPACVNVRIAGVAAPTWPRVP